MPTSVGVTAFAFSWVLLPPCKMNHPANKCDCKEKVRQIRRGESVNKAYAHEGNELLVIQGTRGLPNTLESPEEMASAFQHENRS